MFKKESIEKIGVNNKKWQQLFQESVAKAPERLKRFSTVSDHPVQNLYTPLDIKDLDYSNDIGFPNQYPFTSGVHTTMYRG